MRCPLCGFVFSREEGEKACGGCPVGKGCELVCCPHCHYQWPAGSKTERLLRRLFSKGGGIPGKVPRPVSDGDGGSSPPSKAGSSVEMDQ